MNCVSSFARRPLRWWVAGNEETIAFMCYDRLQADFDALIKPYCKPDCELVQQNPSNHTLILGVHSLVLLINRLIRVG